MDENEISIINSKDFPKVSEVLQNFVNNNENKFAFPHLSENNMRISLWAALFEHLQEKSAESIHTDCLTTLRVLSRDKTEVENLICERWMITLIEKAGLYNFIDPSEDITENEMPSKEIAVEALKCLCNIAFNSEVARALCAHTSMAQGLVARLRSYKEIPYKEDIIIFDMKLLFILTALRQDIRAKIKNELHGMDYLISCLGELVSESLKVGEEASGGSQQVILNDQQVAIACEILKTQFNMMYHSGPEEPVTAEEEAMCLKLMPVLTSLLMAETHTWEKLMELHSNIANLLTSVPSEFYEYLSPKCNDGEQVKHLYDGRNMEAIHGLLQLMQHRLTITTSTSVQYENLSPILTVLNKSARSVRAQRKYLRQTVLPPLRDVSRPPEKGSTLRNQLCRLLTTPVTSVRDLVAEFLFILCKEKVGRMVKYTGFGNAAGHLAQKGLMCGGRGPVQYSSSSEDSDTEEYLEAQPHIDPVVGCTRPPRVNPFENMTEEQKEYEAMKLVNLFDKMLSDGVVKPATIGPDGKPKPMEHVLEMRENPPNRPQS
ncbi:synembryn-A [Zerene cesonia]|uniref:synembryn-A n=1 Tax=Zerene cesonia TaxID=33412 RepID=UPI0018E588FB|nr:synembryn-A [Zerene cesonia]